MENVIKFVIFLCVALLTPFENKKKNVLTLLRARYESENIFKYYFRFSIVNESKTIFEILIFIAWQSDLMLSFHIPFSFLGGSMFAQFQSHQRKELSGIEEFFF